MVWLVLFQPGWTVPTWRFQLDVELLECLFQLLLVSSIVRSYGIVEHDELVMQYLHLFQSRERKRRWAHWKAIRWHRYVEQSWPLTRLILFQELQLDGDVVSHPLVLLAVDLELLLGVLNLGHGVGITWPQIQLLQICTVRVILNPRKMISTASEYVMCTLWCKTRHDKNNPCAPHPVCYVKLLSLEGIPCFVWPVNLQQDVHASGSCHKQTSQWFHTTPLTYKWQWLTKICTKALKTASGSLSLKDTLKCVLVSNTEHKHKFSLFTRKLHGIFNMDSNTYFYTGCIIQIIACMNMHMLACVRSDWVLLLCWKFCYCFAWSV